MLYTNVGQHLKMDFTVDYTNIPNSFDNIARQLLLSHVISINNTDIEITEIEFYFFKEGIHSDNYTHPHTRRVGQWRLHKQGIDITFDGTTKGQDGGILIRGIKIGDRYVNGPIKCLTILFEEMQDVSNKNYIVLKSKTLGNSEIIKTFRHLPNKIQYKDFHHKKYRYLKNFDSLSLSQKIKDSIKANFKTI